MSSAAAPKARLRVLLAGGGSGGSATPVLAVAQALRRLESRCEFLYVGTRGGPEAALAAAEGIPFAGVSTGKLRRYWDRQNLTDPFKVVAGLAQAYVLVRRFRPQLAFAAGGFGAVPPMVAARLAGARTLIHQQDVEPGLANRLLVPFATAVTVSLPSSLPHFSRHRSGGRVTVCGNPVRESIYHASPLRAIVEFGLDASVPLLLVTGGGTGARVLNALVAAAVPRLVPEVQVVHLTGRGRAVAPSASSARYHAREFVVDEMPDLLAAASLVVSRAGMGTLSELAALAKPALVVPMPDSHQWANARAFAALGAIEVADQAALTPELLSERVLGLMADPPRRARLGQAMANAMPRDAADRIAQHLLALRASV